MTTLGELKNVLEEMLAEGIDEDTPVLMRAFQGGETNMVADPYTLREFDDVWYSTTYFHGREGVVLIDEEGS